MKIVADKNIPYLKGVVEQYGEVSYLAGNEFTKEAIKNADTLIVRTVTHFGGELLEGSSVKLICSATIGFDHIDTTYCDTHGISWTNAPGCNSGSVQQYIVSALIYLAEKKNLSLPDLTIGIVGVGNVGKKVAKACQLLGMKVLLNDPPRAEKEGRNDFVDLETIKQEADIITFHTPLNKEGRFATYHLADENFFDSLRKAPFIINSARGAIIDTTAIKQALKDAKIQGAIIDCWEKEPTIDVEYFNLVDLATPHIAGYSADGKSNASKMSLQALATFWNLNPDAANTICPPNAPNPMIDMVQFAPDSNRVYQAIRQTYDITADYHRMLANLELFKDLRNNYPLRREYLAYTVIGANTEEAELLKALGFNLK